MNSTVPSHPPTFHPTPSMEGQTRITGQQETSEGGLKFPTWNVFLVDRLERNSLFTYLQQKSLYELLELSISVSASFQQTFHSSSRGSLHHHHHQGKALPWAFPSARHRPLTAGHSSSRQLLALLCSDLPQYPGQRQLSTGRLHQTPR